MIKTFSKKEESKLEEGNIKTIDNEQNVEDITLAVSTEVPEPVDKVEKDDKQAFEEFKTMYKGVIDIKCRQDFGDCEDEKLWEDTAKELFLQSKNYILVGDEYKAKEDLDDHLEKIEESKELKTEVFEEGNSIFEMKFDCSNTDIFGEGWDLNDTVGSKVSEIAEKIKSGSLDGAIMDKNGNKIGSYGVGYEGVQSALDESVEAKVESRSNDVEDRVNQAKEWKQKVEDAVEATDLEEIVDEILEFAEDIKDNNFAGEDLYSGMSGVMDNGDAEARGPVTYVRSVKRDMQNILDDFIDNYEQAFEEESLEESKLEEAVEGMEGLSSKAEDVTDSFKYIKPFEANFGKIKIIKEGSHYWIYRGDAKDGAEYIDHSDSIAYIEGWLQGAIKANNKVITPLTEVKENNFEHEYQMLDRLRTDCEYYLKNGNRSAKHLWANDEQAQIDEMRRLYDLLPEKPEWLSEEDINNYEKEMCSKQAKIEEKRTLPENEKEILKNNMRKILKDHGKFKDDEEIEDYIEEFMPMWVEAQENLGSEVLPLDEEKELKTEDQYEMERRRGKPNVKKIAEMEYYDNLEWYQEHIKDYTCCEDFVDKNNAEFASEYNLKTKELADEVAIEVYMLATKHPNRVTESMVTNYTLDQISKVLDSGDNYFRLKISADNNDVETKWLGLDKEDLNTLYKALTGNE